MTAATLPTPLGPWPALLDPLHSRAWGAWARTNTPAQWAESRVRCWQLRFEFADGVQLKLPVGTLGPLGEVSVEIGSDMDAGEARGGTGKDKVWRVHRPPRMHMVLLPCMCTMGAWAHGPPCGRTRPVTARGP